ncbi:unnamed protein product [Cunninghamella echinulata]
MKFQTVSFFLPLFSISTLFLTGSEGVLQHKKLKQLKDTSDIIPGRYIVEFNTENKVKTFSKLLLDIFDKDIQLGEEYNNPIFNGLSFLLKDPSSSSASASSYDSKLSSLFDQDDIKSVYPVVHIKRPEVTYSFVNPNTNGNNTETFSPHHLTQVDCVHKELKNTGKGIVIGIIDSGVDYNHEALGGGFGKGYKVAYGEDLVGDAYGSLSPLPVYIPGTPPLDKCGKATGANGHGTHVAGIIAGKSANFTGVAPDATLGMWRVFGCTGGSASDVIIKAMLKAFEAGCDIISLSLGSSNAWTESVYSDIVTRISSQGVPVIIAAGNEGSTGAMSVGSPSVSHGALSIASFDSEKRSAAVFQATGSIKSDFEYLSTTDDIPKEGTLVIGDKNVGSGQDACSASTVTSDIKGNFAIIQRGACTFEEKATILSDAGAIGAIVYNNAGDDVFGMSAPNSKIPLIGIGQSNGQALVDAIKKGKVSVTFDGKSIIQTIPSAKTVSSFSSVGASYELDLRPNVGGIGGFVYSTLPSYLGSYGFMSGTSMATPYVSGSVALYLKSLEKEKKPSTQFIYEQFQHYSYKAPSVNGQKNIDSPLRQGAGLVQVYDIITQKVHVSPSQISFNDTASSTQYKTHTLKITNHGAETVSYQVLNSVTLSVKPYDLKKSGYTYTEPISYSTDAAKLRISKKTIKVAPGKTINVKVTVIPPKTNPKEHIMYGGYVQFKSSNKKVALDLTVPYFGVVGRQKDLPIFDDFSGFPFLSDKEDGSTKYEKNDTLVLRRLTGSAYFFTRFVSPTAHFVRELVDVKTGKVIGEPLPSGTYIARHTLTPGNQYIAEKWSGTYRPTSIPLLNLLPTGIPVRSGTYKIRFKALRIFGDSKKPEDYHIWESPNIQVKGLL